jgi:hypothetical protein
MSLLLKYRRVEGMFINKKFYCGLRTLAFLIQVYGPRDAVETKNCRNFHITPTITVHASPLKPPLCTNSPIRTEKLK